MTSRREQKRRRAAHAHRIDPDATYGIQPAWCASEADLAECRRLAHDQLIAQMGDRRTGPVEWLWFEGDSAKQRLSDLMAGAVGAHSDYYRRIGAHLREYGGLLVIAMAEGRSA